MVCLTVRDIDVLKFISKWRFVTIDQLLQAGIFTHSRKTSYKRLADLREGKLIANSYLSFSKKPYYYLTQRGGEKISLLVPWHSKIFRNASQNTVLKCLTACDFSLANNVKYLSLQETFERLKSANYDILKSALKGSDLFFERNAKLYALLVDYDFSMRYLADRVKLYSRLSAEIKDQLLIIFLVFNENKRKQVINAIGKKSGNFKVIKGDWKY